MKILASGLDREQSFKPSIGSHTTIPELKPGDRIHFIGIGGIGVSALAYLCLQQGFRVTGSDRRANAQTRRLTESGAVIELGEHPELVENCDLVVYSSAVAAKHPERLMAGECSIPSVRRGTMLAYLVRDRDLLGVAGTHGKTSTSSMLAIALRHAELDPMVVLGGNLPQIDGNAWQGRPPYCVAETDESDGSFLELSPYLALVTNVEDDHLEYYGNQVALEEAFYNYLAQVPNPARRIVCADCVNLYAMARRRLGQAFISYGFSAWSDIRGTDLHLDGQGSSCTVLRHNQPVAELTLPIPGRHMLCNALGVLATCAALGVNLTVAAQGLKNYTGTGRRFEIIGNWRKATLVDDYAHHPTEIKVTLQSLAQFSTGRQIVVFQPHRYSRTDQFFEELGKAFVGTENLILTDIYSAGEQPRPGVDTKHLLPQITGVENVYHAPTLSDVSTRLKTLVQEGDTILFMGAGDINQVGYQLIAEEQK